MALKRPPRFNERSMTVAQVKNFGDDTLKKLDPSKIVDKAAKRYVLSAHDRLNIEIRKKTTEKLGKEVIG